MTFSTIYSPGAGGYFGSPYTPFWIDVEGVLWAGLADDNTGAGKVAYSSDSGATWTVKDFASDLGIADYPSGASFFPIVSGNTLLVIYTSTTADVVVKRFTITRNGKNITSLTNLNIITTIVGLGTGTARLASAELLSSDIAVCCIDYNPGSAFFTRIKISTAEYTDLSGVANSTTTISPAVTSINDAALGLHPASHDLYCCIQASDNSVTQYRFAKIGGNWSNTPTTVALPSLSTFQISMVKDTTRGRMMVIYPHTSVSPFLLSWSWWDGSNNITTGTLTVTSVSSITLCLIFASTANITPNIAGQIGNGNGTDLGFETYALSNSAGDIILLTVYGSPLHLYQYTFNGTSWSGSTDLGAVSVGGPNHLVFPAQFLPEVYVVIQPQQEIITTGQIFAAVQEIITSGSI
jgi:hypothetical protein